MKYRTINDYDLILVAEETGKVYGLDMTSGTDSGLVDLTEIREEASDKGYRTEVYYKDGDRIMRAQYSDVYRVPQKYIDDLSDWLKFDWLTATDDATVQAIRAEIQDSPEYADTTREEDNAAFDAKQASIAAARWYLLDEAASHEAIAEKEYDAQEVDYNGGESRYTPGKAIDYMLLQVDNVELYAECEPDDKGESYNELLTEIKRQAEENGLEPDWIH